jgi:integrase
MASAAIRTRTTRTGEKRYQVRYRLGGRAYPLQHGGVFATMREARIRRDLVAGELAAGRDPAILLRSLQERPQQRSFAVWADAYLASRVDASPKSRRIWGAYVKAMLPAFGDNDPATITTDQVQAWIGGLELAPVSVKKYAATLRTILDYAGVDPNPARDQRIRLPREQRSVVEPPSMVEVEVMIDYAPARYRLLLRVLAETGMRVGEVCALEWRDVDASGSRFRIREGKTAAARRWVAVPEPLMMELDAATPPDDRTPQRRVFGGATPSGVKSMLARVCKNAGIAHYHPHDLRHRYASVQISRGVPVTHVAAQLGHSRNSLTWTSTATSCSTIRRYR